jgi:hypothetical protein
VISPAALVGRCVRLTVALGALLTLAMTAAPAHALQPWWRLDASSAPTLLPRTGEAQFIVTARNLGDGAVVASSERPVLFSYVLPAGIRPLEPVEALASRGVPGSQQSAKALSGCRIELLSGGRTAVRCEFKKTLPQYEILSMRITARMEEPAEAQPQGEVTVQGANAPAASLRKALHVGGGETPFGVEAFTMIPELEGGATDTLAGSHPFQLTTTLDLDETLASYEAPKEHGLFPSAPALPHDLRFHLPPGLVGDPGAVPQCSEVDFDAISPLEATNLCPADTAVGVASVVVNDPVPLGFDLFTVPVFNLAPAEGEPARFGFEVQGVPVVLRTALPAGGEYGVEVIVEDVSQAAQVLSSEVTLWGDPADPSHDSARGWECIGGGTWLEGAEPPRGCEPDTLAQTAFLTMPTSCAAPAQSTVEGDSWSLGSGRSGSTATADFQFPFTFSGCEGLGFVPSLSIEPEQTQTSVPTGINATLQMPQPGLLAPGGQAESALRSTTVELPEGLVLNPAGAGGLSACEPTPAGFIESGQGSLREELSEQLFTPSLPPVDLQQPGINVCADSAKVGTVSVQTPLLSHELQGSLYLGSQDTDPFASPLVLYLIASDPVSGVVVKLAGEVDVSPSGRLTTSFRNTPQLPFQRITLHFFGGPRAALATPKLCGSYSSEAELVPWSEEATATPAVAPFAITAGNGGGACPQGSAPFSPSLQAGATNGGAGAFTGFQLEVAHPDGDQDLTGLTVQLPPGLGAILKSVVRCPEPQASLGQCGPESEIGQSVASAGVGSQPIVQDGRVYLTGPYDGAPFGLSIVTPAKAGPFDLGEVVVRAAIRVDPATAAVTVSSALPTVVQGIGEGPSGVPLALKGVQVKIDRPGFQYNPTDCDPLQVEAAMSGQEGATATQSAPFQVSGCAELPFKPVLSASTQGQASRLDGASLTVTVTSSPGQANIAKTVLTLPKQLPSRLSTIQKACPQAVFQADPAGCPEGSVIGSATVRTPVLATPLSGPGYLVSHGGEAFPDVEFVLQSEGVQIVLDGHTHIKNGITTSSFESVPDAPLERFEAVLPEGPHSALGTYLPEADGYDLCTSSLTMPTTITGQNGAVIARTTKIAVTGCGAVRSYKAAKPTRAQRLAKALKACRKRLRAGSSARAQCEARARRTFVVRRSKARARGRG